MKKDFWKQTAALARWRVIVKDIARAEAALGCDVCNAATMSAMKLRCVV